MKAYWLLLLFLLTLLPALYSEPKELTVITHSETPGFGFIVYVKEAGYIVTAYHVVETEWESAEYNKKVIIQFYNGSTCIGEIISVCKDLDLAIIKTEIVPYYYKVYFVNQRIDVNKNDYVGLIGRNGEWLPTSSINYGKVKSISDKQIIAGFTGSCPGSSGGPLVSENKIAGMITDDDNVEKLVYALPINTIMEYFQQIVPTDPVCKSFPFYSFGIQGIMSGPLYNSFQYEVNTHFMGGLFFNVFINHHFWIRSGIDWMNYVIKDKEDKPVLYPFKNQYPSFFIQSHLSTNCLNDIVNTIFIGTTWHLNHMFFFKDDEWISIDDFSQIDIQNKQLFSIDFGFNTCYFGVNGKGVLVMNAQLSYFPGFTNYIIYIDDDHILEYHWVLQIDLGFGLNFKHPYIVKLLR